MSEIAPKKCTACILVKALPRPSEAHGETVCCAGFTLDRQLKRLYPVRFRHLSSAETFKRWDWVTFQYAPSRNDQRAESCRILEGTMSVDGRLKEKERSGLIWPLLSHSIQDAADAGKSLALIQPKNTEFYFRKKPASKVEAEREAYRKAARQLDMFDDELAAFNPSPYDFRFRFEDGTGEHRYSSTDWETHAMFFNRRRQYGSDRQALDWMNDVFNGAYKEKGMVFCVGNIARYPKTWQLLGVLRISEPEQQSFVL